MIELMMDVQTKSFTKNVTFDSMHYNENYIRNIYNWSCQCKIN